MIFFTSDEHYDHKNIIKFCNRPFENTSHMNTTLIKNHNKVVKEGDIVYHIGDFTLRNTAFAKYIINKLNGNNVFINGSHDYWLKGGILYSSNGSKWKNTKGAQLLDIIVEKQAIVLCHYMMYIWPKSHFNSWHLFGHSHGGWEGHGKAYDVGVDNNNFYPVSFDEIKVIMNKKNNNVNYVNEGRY